MLWLVHFVFLKESKYFGYLVRILVIGGGRRRVGKKVFCSQKVDARAAGILSKRQAWYQSRSSEKKQHKKGVMVLVH